MVKKYTTAKAKMTPVVESQTTQVKRTRDVHGWKKKNVSKSIVILTDEGLRKDLLLAIDKTGIKSPTNTIRHVVKLFADEIRKERAKQGLPTEVA